MERDSARDDCFLHGTRVRLSRKLSTTGEECALNDLLYSLFARIVHIYFAYIVFSFANRASSSSTLRASLFCEKLNHTSQKSMMKTVSGKVMAQKSQNLPDTTNWSLEAWKSIKLVPNTACMWATTVRFGRNKIMQKVRHTATKVPGRKIAAKTARVFIAELSRRVAAAMRRVSAASA